MFSQNFVTPSLLCHNKENLYAFFLEKNRKSGIVATYVDEIET